MKKLLNTLYLLTPDSYLFCRNETIAVKVGGVKKTPCRLRILKPLSVSDK